MASDRMTDGNTIGLAEVAATPDASGRAIYLMGF